LFINPVSGKMRFNFYSTYFRWWAILIGLCCLIGCTPEATPFPVDIPPTAGSTPPPGSNAAVRYALAANTEGYVADMGLIKASAQVEQLIEPINPAELGARFDLAAAYGDLPDGVRSPVMPHVALVINPAASPLNDPTLLAVLRRSLNPAAMITVLDIPGATADTIESTSPSVLRTELANAGWPDGMILSLAYAYTPGAAQIAEQLGGSGIHVRLSLLPESEISSAFDDETIQAALIAWETPEERQIWIDRFDETNVIDLYAVPISYIAVEGLTVSFSSAGWPLPTSS
jgi:hypothetical protein